MEVDDRTMTELKTSVGVLSDRETQSSENPAENSAHIFELSRDCFGELLDWLSLKDLHAFGQTCKLLQKIAGHVFQTTYCAAFAECKPDGIYIDSLNVNAFCSFISRLSFQNDNIKCFEFAATKDFKYLNRILLNGIHLTDEKIVYLKKLLKKAETVELTHCTIDGDVYKKLLKRCINMKRLCVNVNEPVGTVIGTDNKWLLRPFPKLEYFELSGIGQKTNVNELITFFELNGNIHKFATNDQCLLMKWTKKTNVLRNLTDLAVHCVVYKNDRPQSFRKTTRRLRKLNKYVQLYVDHAYQSTLNKISSKQRIEKFHAQSLSVIRTDRVFFFPLGHLVELCIPFVLNDIDVVIMAKQLENLQQLLVDTAQPEIILTFIRHSVRLERIAVRLLESGFGNKMNCLTVDVSMWNKERAKLTMAEKTIVYVNEIVYLATKWTKDKIDGEFVKLKRFDTFDWNHDFGFV